MTARGARYEAMQKGERHYMPEKPCKRGHLALKSTSDGKCIECRKINEKATYYADPEKTKARTKKKYDANAEKIRQRRKDYYVLNIETEREKSKLGSREWRKNNPGHRNALAAKYRADTNQATPAWAADQKDMIKAKYQLATMLSRETGVLYHVHHEIPLRAELACGLHVFENLRVITAKENLELSNHFEVI